MALPGLPLHRVSLGTVQRYRDLCPYPGAAGPCVCPFTSPPSPRPAAVKPHPQGAHSCANIMQTLCVCVPATPHLFSVLPRPAPPPGAAMRLTQAGGAGGAGCVPRLGVVGEISLGNVQRNRCRQPQPVPAAPPDLPRTCRWMLSLWSTGGSALLSAVPAVPVVPAVRGPGPALGVQAPQCWDMSRHRLAGISRLSPPAAVPCGVCSEVP